MPHKHAAPSEASCQGCIYLRWVEGKLPDPNSYALIMVFCAVFRGVCLQLCVCACTVVITHGIRICQGDMKSVDDPLLNKRCARGLLITNYLTHLALNKRTAGKPLYDVYTRDTTQRTVVPHSSPLLSCSISCVVNGMCKLFEAVISDPPSCQLWGKHLDFGIDIPTKK